MGHLSSYGDDATQPPDLFAGHHEVSAQWRRAWAAQESLRQMGRPRVNMLFIGADDIVWRVLGTSLSLGSPIANWKPGTLLGLPVETSARTLIIREVGDMTIMEQMRLLDWLGRAVGRTQVVCTSSETLLPLIEDGRFISALYYRLNTICIDLTE